MSSELSLEDAGELFKAYGCTHFHMARDEPELYSKYKKLKVTDAQETLWTEESFFEICNQLIDCTDSPGCLWLLHSSATTLAEYLESEYALRKLYQTTIVIIDLVPIEDSIMCAESILDRRDLSTRCGIIFLSLDLGLYDLSIKFIQLADMFIARFGETNPKRSSQAIDRSKQISSILEKEAPNKRMQSDAAKPRR